MLLLKILERIIWSLAFSWGRGSGHESHGNRAAPILRSLNTVITVGMLAALCTPWSNAQGLVLSDRASSLRLLVVEENASPMLRMLLSSQPVSDRGIEVVFPEHVTVREQGKSEAEHLYLFQTGGRGNRPAWRRVGQSLEYDMELKTQVHMLARAALESDGVRYRYDFVNRSSVNYEMLQAITDPRLRYSTFQDVRLERTYVHHKDGFDLLGSETPSRLTMPENEWLPCRYLAPFTWPVVPRRVEQTQDGITWHHKSRRVDEPFIATVSKDGKWIVATCTRETGNVWVNPELTCQHADPQTTLEAGGKASLEVKTFVFRGTLKQALEKVKRARKRWDN